MNEKEDALTKTYDPILWFPQIEKFLKDYRYHKMGAIGRIENKFGTKPISN